MFMGHVTSLLAGAKSAMVRMVMAKQATSQKIGKAPAKRGAGYPALVKAISQVNTQMVTRAATAVNQSLVLRNWMIGSWINSYQKLGADRAKYGDRLFTSLAKDLSAQGVKGCGERMLQQMSVFSEFYPQMSRAIPQAVFAELGLSRLSFDSANTGCGIAPSRVDSLKLKSKADSSTMDHAIRQPLDTKLPTPLEPAQLAGISWAHFLELIRLDDPWQRAFYENELRQEHWSVRQLQRQIGSLLYERTGLSTNKKAVIERARKQSRKRW